MNKVYDRDGNPIDDKRWGLLSEDDDYRRVGLDFFNGVSVSTVWLGLDHNYGDGPPLIFETMVFGGQLDQEQWRYSTEEQALTGHAHVLELVRGFRGEREP